MHVKNSARSTGEEKKVKAEKFLVGRGKERGRRAKKRVGTAEKAALSSS